jgi:rare lipoprotein A
MLSATAANFQTNDRTRRNRMKLVHLRNTLCASAVALCVSTAGAQTSSAAAPASAPAAAAAAAATETGKLAWYGKKFAGRKTASGEAFNPEALTMAHKTLPFGTLVKVTNPKNGKSVTLRVNDRGPTQADRVGDVSYAAARRLGMVGSGVIDAEMTVVGMAKGKKR